MKVRCNNTQTQVGEFEYIDFGITDSKGRAVGVVVRRFQYVYTPRAEATGAAWMHEAGTFYAVGIQATRNGQQYGGSSAFVEAGTLEAANRMAAGKVAQAKARAVKVHAK
jgi:hypothetical protein